MKNLPSISFILIGVILMGLSVISRAQSDLRTRIDSERKGLNFSDPKTLEKAKGFIRQDSTYFIGYMIQGAYMFYRANDKLGFQQVIVPLQKALIRIEKDYDRQLRTRSNDYYIYSAVYSLHSDYGYIAYLLERSYQNIEEPQQAMDILRHVLDRNFQLEQGVDSYNTMAWLCHRNRVYTSRQFPFLKNSVKENVKLAYQYLDSALRKNELDITYNRGLFNPAYLNRMYLSTYHYKAMINDYNLEIDSADYYYNVLISNNAYSSNNYAEFKLAMGELQEAERYFKEAEVREASEEKKTKEYYYMQGTLNTYRSRPELADTLLRKVLEQQGSTPGYGWHSIGLARAQHYEGLTEESQLRNNKAARFQELHIGTTWGQEQYNLAVAALNYTNQLQFKREYFFENDQWWFWLNPLNWYRWIRFSLEIHHHKLLLASLVARNPEREQVIYSIFSSENLVTFDEVFSIIDGFGNEYFIDTYQKLLVTDKRPKLKKYFHYFLGKLYLAEGREREARQHLMQVLSDPDKEDEFVGLLFARVYESLASMGEDELEWTIKMYERFPQLVPFSDLTMSFKLEATGTDGNNARQVLKDLKKCDINFISSGNLPLVQLKFSETSDGLEIHYAVNGTYRTISEGSLLLGKNDIEEGGKMLAYRLFRINKQKTGVKPEVAPLPLPAPANI